MEVIITSGGTISRIDDVRHIGNFSVGITGARIAEEFLRRGATVAYVHNRRAERPLRAGLALDPDRPLVGELERLTGACREYQDLAPRLREHPFETFEEYQALVQGLLEAGTADAIVLAAAVSDYGARPHAGKLSSDQPELRVDLVRLPKVISRVKAWQPGVFLVGFKLLSRVGLDELVEVAWRHGQKNGSDLTVANTLGGGDFRERQVVLVNPGREVTPVSVAGLPAALADAVYANLAPAAPA